MRRTRQQILPRNRRVRRPMLEDLEQRTLLSGLSLVSATVLPDGRTVQVAFTEAKPAQRGIPSWRQGFEQGVRLKTNTGLTLENIGSWVTTDDANMNWTATYLINDPTQPIVFKQDNLKLSAEAGLLQDGAGNSTNAIVNVPVINKSLVDASGFTTQAFQRGTGGVTIYVSSTFGDDRNGFQQAQNPATPLKTLTAALDQVWKNGMDGKGADIRLLRGDTFAAGGAIKTSGQDREHPFIIEDYWFQYQAGATDPQTRPTIAIDEKAATKSSVFDTTSGGGTPASVNNVVIRRISLQAQNWEGNLGSRYGIDLLRGGSNWTIDDCEISNFGVNLVVQGHWGPFADVTLLRTIVTDSRYDNSLIKEHTQGLFVQNTTGLLISQCTFDHNGRVSADRTGRDLYSHNIYIKEDCGPSVLWGNVLRGGGSYGVELRSGGAIAYNYFGRNALAAFVDGVGGSQYKNVVEKGEDISPKMPRGFGLQMTTTYKSSIAQTMEYNIVVNGLGHYQHAITMNQSGTNHIELASVMNNTFVNAGNIQFNSSSKTPGYQSVQISKNVIDNAGDFLFESSPYQEWKFLKSDQNLLNNTRPAKGVIRIGNQPISLEQWTSTANNADANSVKLVPAYKNPNADIGGYFESIGGKNDEAGFVQKLRTRPAGVWGNPQNTLKIYNYFSKAYQADNLPKVGEGPFNDYGVGTWGTTTPFGNIDVPAAKPLSIRIPLQNREAQVAGSPVSASLLPLR